MSPVNKFHVIIVDDDNALRRLAQLGISEAEPRLPVRTFESPDGCLDYLRSIGRVKAVSVLAGQRRVEEEIARLSFAVEESSDWVLMADRQGKITYVNKAVERISGYRKEELVGQNPRIFSSGTHDKGFYAEFWKTIVSGRTFQGMLTDRKKSGELFEIFHTITPLKDIEGNITSYIATSKDMTLQKELEERVHYLSYHDALTGLPNRALLVERLGEWLARAPYNNRHSAVFSIDIDRFSFIVDTFGAATGDKILVEVGRILSGSVREGDTVARVGSDEFAVGLIDIADTEDVIILAERVMNGFSRPLEVDGEDVVLDISMGVSVYPNDGRGAFDLIKNADLARSKIMGEGGKGFYFYNPAIEKKAAEFVLLERRLFKALRDGEFVLHYQPYIDTASKRLAGMEALLRWNSPELGMVPPGKFIAVLEETKMIIEVGEWSLITALRQLKSWLDKGYQAIPVSVNLSPAHFGKKDILDVVRNTIKDAGLPPSLLNLEITESALMRDVDLAKSTLKSFKDMGISISIDDFGTGYSSLSYLKMFSVDYLKIDISFIRDIASDPDAASIISAIIAMSHSLNIRTVAEGVETEQQWNILRLLRCDVIQGYYFSKPLDAAGMESWLSAPGVQERKPA